MDREEFIRVLTEEFPEVVGHINDYAHGLLHCEIADFRRVVETAMDRGALWQVGKYLQFVEKCREAAGPDLANAIDVSFLEDFALGEFNDCRHQAVRERMPGRLRERVISVSERWR